MDVYVPNDVANAIVQRAKDERKRRVAMRVEDETGQHVPLLSFSENGFSVSDDAPQLRGEVSVHQGARHVLDCLIVAAVSAEGETRYEYKRSTAVLPGQPLDYVLDRAAPTALIGKR